MIFSFFEVLSLKLAFPSFSVTFQSLTHNRHFLIFNFSFEAQYTLILLEKAPYSQTSEQEVDDL